MDASGVTLAILNYNGLELLQTVLPSIAAQTATGFGLHVIDNASTDGSVEYLAEQWPQVRVFPSPVNRGVTVSMARAVASTETEYMALLNNDLELDPRWLEEMLKALESRPRAAAADGKMLQFYDRARLDGAGDVMGRNGYPGRRGKNEVDVGQYEEPGEVFSATGGAALYRRAAFELVGSFDEDLGAYYEDVDWGFRARLLGLSTIYVPTAISYHMGSRTLGGERSPYASRIIRNQLIVLVKDFPLELLVRLFPGIAFFQLKWLVFNWLHGLGPAHMRGLLGFACTLPRTLRKRWALQRARTASAAEIERALS